MPADNTVKVTYEAAVPHITSALVSSCGIIAAVSAYFAFQYEGPNSWIVIGPALISILCAIISICLSLIALVSYDHFLNKLLNPKTQHKAEKSRIRSRIRTNRSMFFFFLSVIFMSFSIVGSLNEHLDDLYSYITSSGAKFTGETWCAIMNTANELTNFLKKLKDI